MSHLPFRPGKNASHHERGGGHEQEGAGPRLEKDQDAWKVINLNLKSLV